MLYVISYDITDDKTRSKVSKLLQGRGVRVQYSVFECLVDRGDLPELRERLETHLNQEDGDSIRLYPLPQDAMQAVEVLGTGEAVYNPGQLRIF